MNSTIENDEIDLMKMFKAFWRGKWVILSLMFIVTLSAFFYTQKIKPVYQAKLIVMPPINNDLFNLNNNLSEFIKKYYNSTQPITFQADEIYKLFLEILSAESTKREFLEAQRLKHKNDKDNIPISLTVYRNDIDRFTVIVNAHSGKAALVSTNELMEMVRDQEQRELDGSIQKLIETFTQPLDNEITSQRLTEEARQALVNYQLKHLKFSKVSDRGSHGSNTKNTAVDIDKMESRLKNLEEKRAGLPNFTPDYSNVLFSRASGTVEITETYIRYKSKIFIAFAMAFGFILGCVLIILWNFKSLLVTKKPN